MALPAGTTPTPPAAAASSDSLEAQALSPATGLTEFRPGLKVNAALAASLAARGFDVSAIRLLPFSQSLRNGCFMRLWMCGEPLVEWTPRLNQVNLWLEGTLVHPSQSSTNRVWSMASSRQSAS